MNYDEATQFDFFCLFYFFVLTREVQVLFPYCSVWGDIINVHISILQTTTQVCGFSYTVHSGNLNLNYIKLKIEFFSYASHISNAQ